MSLDLGTFAVLMIAAALAGLLIGILPTWRQMGSGHRLPVWGFLTRQSAPLDGRTALQAEMLCSLCGAKTECVERLKAGAVQPAENCPNAALFKDS